MHRFYRRVLNDQKDGIDKDSDCYKATLCSANDYTPDHPFDVVVSNPPYIPRGDMDTLTDDVTKFESDEALCGGTDGLDVIRTIIEKLPHWCNSEAVCWMEVDPSHPKMIEELLSLEGKGDTNEDETSGNELPMQKRRVRHNHHIRPNHNPTSSHITQLQIHAKTKFTPFRRTQSLRTPITFPCQQRIENCILH